MATHRFLIIASAFLYALKKVSFLTTTSAKTQMGNTVMITAITNPKGLSSKELKILPSVSNITARVVPQDGHG